jgi:hypothetical protein
MSRLGFLLLTLAVGCSSNSTGPTPADEEGAVRMQFAELQSAMRSGDAEKVWELLDSKSQGDAEHVARDLQAVRSKAGVEEKAKQEEALGLPGAELDRLTGQGFLRTRRFQSKYHELPASRIEKVTVQGDNATVYYLEPDGDKEKLIFVRQGGRWKVWLAMPKASKP